MASKAVVLFSLHMVLAGCVGADAPTGSEGVAVPRDPAAQTAPGHPEWHVGQWWRIHAVVDFGQGAVEETTGRIAVSSATEQGFTTGSEEPDLAIYDAYFDSILVGPFDRDLSPIVYGDTVRLYSWPLGENLTWSTIFHIPSLDEERSIPVTVSLSASRPQEEDGATDRWRITGSTDHGETIDYDYDPATGWMTYLRMVNATTGRIVLSVDVTESGTSFDGEVHRFEVSPLYERVAVIPPCDGPGGQCGIEWSGLPPTETFDVAGRFDFVEEIHFLFTYPFDVAGGGYATDVVTRPDGSMDRVDHAGAGDTFEYRFVRRTVPSGFDGTWTVSVSAVGTGGLFVGVYGFTETLPQRQTL